MWKKLHRCKDAIKEKFLIMRNCDGIVADRAPEIHEEFISLTHKEVLSASACN